jgi:hypothetical protein
MDSSCRLWLNRTSEPICWKEIPMRSTTIRFLCFGVLVLSANSWAQQRPAIVEKIAKTYGLDSWDQIQAIRYTWNVQFGAVNISHSWEWEHKTGKVSYEGKDKDGKPVKVTYMRSELGSQPDAVKNEIDPAFINDNYTLLFPALCRNLKN